MGESYLLACGPPVSFSIHPASRLQTTQPSRGEAVTVAWQMLCKLCRYLLPSAMGTRFTLSLFILELMRNRSPMYLILGRIFDRQTILGSDKSRIKKDDRPNACTDCGNTPHDVKHLFGCPAQPTILIPSE